MTNNTASGEGGAIYASEGSNVYIVAFDNDITYTGNKGAKAVNSIYLDNADLYLYARGFKDSSGVETKRNITIAGIKATGDSTLTAYGDGNIHLSSLVNVIYSDDDKKPETTDGQNTFEKDTGVNVEKVIQGSDFNDGAIVDPKTGLPKTLSVNRSRLLLSFANENDVQDSSFNLTGKTTLGLANNKIGTLSMNNLSLSDDTTTDVIIDADLKSGTSDKITAENVEGTGTLNVSSVNLTSNSKDAVTINLGEDSLVSSMSATTAETAEATYKLKSSIDNNGLLRAVAYAQKAKPCTLAAPVAAQLGGYLTQINSYDQAFMNMDMNMLLTREEREALNSNRYAYQNENNSDIKLAFNPQFDNGINKNGKGLWTRPYATFERVNLSHGPKVSNIGYGNFFGGDADIKYLNNGWKRQFSAYIGYNGSIQDYDRQSIDQNGGTVGITEVWYKNNFFTGLTLNVGANAVNAQTDLGHENFPMLMAGIASKTGYNFEFKNGKFIIQPSLLLSYSFVHTFSHKNGRGTHVGSSPLHAIQVAPGLKFIFNLPKGWQPYLGINMRWNIMDKTHFSIQDVSIPDMSVKPYVEYGVGVQRKWGERFTGYGQAMIRNGGRNGVMLSFGFKWLLGK